MRDSLKSIALTAAFGAVVSLAVIATAIAADPAKAPEAQAGETRSKNAKSVDAASDAAKAAAAKADAAKAPGPTDPPEGFSDQGFVDAAYNNCATVENRSARSCECERKLIGDRVGLDDKMMAYLYWTDKPKFVERFEAKRDADPEWQKGFAQRFSNLQALIIAACGT